MRLPGDIPRACPVASLGLLLFLGASLGGKAISFAAAATVSLAGATGIASAETAGKFLAGAAGAPHLGTGGIFLPACLGVGIIPPSTFGAACLAAAAAAAAVAIL